MNPKLSILTAITLMVLTSAGSWAQDSLTHQSVMGEQIRLTPSNWLQRTQNAVILFEGNLAVGMDTGFMKVAFPRLTKDFRIIKNDFSTQGSAMRIRILDDVKAKLLQQKTQLGKWRNQVRRQNDALAGNYLEIERMRADSMTQAVKSDSTLRSIYLSELTNLYSNIQRVEQLYQDNLKKTVGIENELNQVNFDISKLIIDVEKELALRNDALFQRTHKPIWELKPNDYKQGIGKVFMATLRQTIDSLEFYAKNAYIRVILFRILLLVITLLPIFYFKKLKKQPNYKEDHQKFRFVHKYTGASTSSFVLVMAPLIFVNSPHIFTEVIFVTLAFTTSFIYLKEHPAIPKWTLFSILGVYVILKAMNLMVSVTYFGRMIWTLSILALIPVYYFIRSVGAADIRNRVLLRTISGLTILMIISGWVLSVTGHYPLGRILLLSGLDQLFLAIILYVAIYSFIDFITVLADLYNSSNRITVVRVDLIYKKLLNLVRILAIILWFYSFAVNVNAAEFLQQNVFSFFSHQFNIGSFSFTPGSIIVFFLVLLFSFYLSSLLDGLFVDEKRTNDNAGKTSLGSIVLMLRLFIIALGFIGGMFIAGIPLNNLTLFVSALGVGIGFGLQSFIANLISGLIIAFEKPIYVGDIIEVEGGSRGRVTDIGIRATKVDTADGAEYIIPNGEIISKVLKNWTLTTRNHKIETSILVDHSNNAQMITEIITDTLKETPYLMPYPKPKIQMSEISAQGMRFAISCWVSNIADAPGYKSELLKSIHDTLADAGVTYPKKDKD